MRKLIALIAVMAFCAAPARADYEVRQIPDNELAAMIGQMIMVGFVGDTENHAWFRQVLSQIRSGQISGILYLKRNIRHKRAVRAMNTATLQAGAGGPAPLIGVDQEGGAVQRLTPAAGFASTPSAHRVARSMAPDEAANLYGKLAKGLRNWGFNLNLGPVADVNVNPGNPIIGRLGRSFSRNPKTVARFAAAFVKGHRRHGILTALKHFPGHGSSREDSHWTIADVSKTWRRAELEPFRDLIQQDAAVMIMSGHIRNSQLAPAADRHPASLSANILTGLLRSKLGYDGVVISDDMQMRAISRHYRLDEAVRRAVLAGTDILIFANDRHPDINIAAKVTAILGREARANSKMLARIVESYQRVLKLKARMTPAPQ